jgi:hypothetical protein
MTSVVQRQMSSYSSLGGGTGTISPASEGAGSVVTLSGAVSGIHDRRRFGAVRDEVGEVGMGLFCRT